MQEKAEKKLKFLATPRQALQRLKVLSHPSRFRYLLSLCRRKINDPLDSLFVVNLIRTGVLETKDIKRYVGIIFILSYDDFIRKLLRVP